MHSVSITDSSQPLMRILFMNDHLSTIQIQKSGCAQKCVPRGCTPFLILKDLNDTPQTGHKTFLMLPSFGYTVAAAPLPNFGSIMSAIDDARPFHRQQSLSNRSCSQDAGGFAVKP